MSLFNPDEPQVVNVLAYLTELGLTEQAAYQLLLHLVLNQAYATINDVHAAASDLNIQLPFIFTDNGQVH